MSSSVPKNVIERYEKLAKTIADHLKNPNLPAQYVEGLKAFYDITNLPLKTRAIKAKQIESEREIII